MGDVEEEKKKRNRPVSTKKKGANEGEKKGRKARIEGGSMLRHKLKGYSL